MATDQELIVKTIAAFLPSGPVMNAAALRKAAEWAVAKRPLNWEEWIDIRDGWAKHYNALVVVLTKGDDSAMRRAERQAEERRYQHLLLEYV